MRRAIVLLVLLGLGVSVHLLLRHFALLGGAADQSVCSIVLHLDCDQALASPMSRMAGLPLAGWGVVHFGTLGVLLLMGHALGDAFAAIATRAALALAFLAACAGVALLVLMATGATPICPLCVVVHAVDFALVPLLARVSGAPLRALPGDVRAAWSAVARSPSPLPSSTRIALLALLGVALAALVMFQTVFTLEIQRRPPPYDVRAAVGAYAMGPRVEIPVDDRDAQFGAADAPLQLVVFSDFECPACRAFATRLAQMVDDSRGKLAATFKHFPADAACNSGVRESRHPHACSAAAAAEAARRQGRFREFHDALFSAELAPTQDVLAGAARRAGLDLARFDADRASDAARKKIADDVALGVRLNVRETPAVFLDGRRVPDISPAALSMILMSRSNDAPIALTHKAPAPGDPADGR
jgi:protein-disulfide isomerase/uncharacterized membrane protein